jgi:hypothetical protein
MTEVMTMIQELYHDGGRLAHASRCGRAVFCGLGDSVVDGDEYLKRFRT